MIHRHMLWLFCALVLGVLGLSMPVQAQLVVTGEVNLAPLPASSVIIDANNNITINLGEVNYQATIHIYDDRRVAPIASCHRPRLGAVGALGVCSEAVD